ISHAAATLGAPSFPTRRSSDLQRAVLERCAAHAGPPSCADFSPRFAHGKKRGRCGGSSPVSALHRAFSSSMDSKPRLNSGLAPRSEEHTSELQSREKLVCRLLL